MLVVSAIFLRFQTPKCEPRAQPAHHFGGVGNFHEILFDDIIVLIQP